MNKELKEQAHKEFDEKWKRMKDGGLGKHASIDGRFIWAVDDDEDQWVFADETIKSFTDSIIDKTVQMTEERIVGVIENYFDSEMEQNKGSRLVYEQLGEDKIRIVKSFITNKSDINK